MADTLFILFIVYLAWVIVSNSYKNWQENYLSSGQIRRHVLERVALKRKYEDMVPKYKNGVLYTRVNMVKDRVGVYSKEFYEENRKLTEKYYGKLEDRQPLTNE